MAAPRVAVATAADVRERDEDWVPFRDALAAAGAQPELVAWDDPGVGWGAFDRVVVRSTWDYYLGRRDEFLAWAAAVAARTHLANPPAVLRWNTDKRYLAELAAAGLPVVPTAFAGPGEDVVLPDAEEVVVKPTVSAGSRDTARHRDRDAARDHVRRLQAAGRTAMVQPYLPAVDDAGESALVFLAGRYSHAVRKGPLLAPGGASSDALWAEEDIRPRDPAPAELAVAEQVLDAVPFRRGDLLYARVDLLPGPDGAPTLLELELTEPSLFLATAPGAAGRLAAATLAG